MAKTKVSSLSVTPPTRRRAPPLAAERTTRKKNRTSSSPFVGTVMPVTRSGVVNVA